MDHSILQKKPFCLDETERQWVSRTISGMSDREKCAQLFNVLGSFYPEDELDKLVADPGVEGEIRLCVR